MPDKLDKLLNGQAELKTSIAVIENELKNREARITKNTEDLEGLKRFKWGIIGTAAVSISTFFKTMFA